MSAKVEYTDFIELLGATAKDQIMVDKDLLLALLSTLKAASIRPILDTAWGNYVPNPDALSVDDKWFRSKVTIIYSSRGLTQRQFAKEAQIDQGDLSKFEAGLKQFGPQRREKLIDALRRLKNTGPASDAIRSD